MVIRVVIVFGIKLARFSIGSYSFVYVINEHPRIVSTENHYTRVRTRTYTHTNRYIHTLYICTHVNTHRLTRIIIIYMNGYF